MSSDDTALAKLAGAILDGTPIDWDAADSGRDASGPPARASPESDRGDRRCPERGDARRCGDRCAFSNGSDKERSATYIERGTRGWIARWRSSCCRSDPVSSQPAGDIDHRRRPACSPASGIPTSSLFMAPSGSTTASACGWNMSTAARFISWWWRMAGASRRSEVAALGQALCGAVAAVHAAGLLHRDIKAQNVMMARRGPGGVDGLRHRA